MSSPPTAEEEPPAIQEEDAQKLLKNKNESRIPIPEVDSKDESPPKWISLGFAKLGDAVRSKNSPSNIQNKVDTRKLYREDAFKGLDTDTKSEIWIDVYGNKVSFAKDYPKTLSCDYVGSPVVQLAQTDNDIFCK